MFGYLGKKCRNHAYQTKFHFLNEVVGITETENLWLVFIRSVSIPLTTVIDVPGLDGRGLDDAIHLSFHLHCIVIPADIDVLCILKDVPQVHTPLKVCVRGSAFVPLPLVVCHSDTVLVGTTGLPS